MANSTLQPISDKEIFDQCHRILESPVFSRSKRQSDFLRHIVTATVEGRADGLKEYALAIDVFKKDPSFDPATDSIVRVEASRLRSKLREYYGTHGSEDAVHIEVPKGHYAVTFSRFGHSGTDRESSFTVDWKKSRFIVGIVTIAAISIVGAYWYFTLQSNLDQSVLLRPQPNVVERSIAVLPFRNSSANTEDVYFVDGIQEDILNQLSKLSSFNKVISRTSMEQYRGTTKSMPMIANELGVESILEGSVQRAGERVRVSVQLIDALNDRQIWSHNYDSELTAENIFTIQEQTAIEVATALDSNLSIEDELVLSDVPTSNLQALEVYFRAKQHMAVRSSEDIGIAISEFELATLLDPNFALAYVGLADAYLLQVIYEGIPVERLSSNIQAAIDQALQLDSNLGEAYVALGYLRYFERSLSESESALRQALDLMPGYALASHRYADTLRDMGRFEEALALQLRAVTLDPRSAINNLKMSYSLSVLGRFDEALLFALKAVDVEPTSPSGYSAVADHYWFALGQLTEAAQWYSRLANIDADTQRTNYFHARLLWDLGEDEQAECWVRRNFSSPVQGTLSYRGMQELALRQGDLDLAADYASEGASLGSTHPEVLVTLRNRDIAQGDLQSARQRYAALFPQLLEGDRPVIDFNNYRVAVDIAKVLQLTNETEQAQRLLNGSLAYLQNNLQRLGGFGYWTKDIEIYALLGRNQEALAALSDAIDENWIIFWWSLLENNPNLESIQQDPTFQAMAQEVREEASAQLAQFRASETSVNVCRAR